jgi:hypothetical protein
MLKIEVDVHSKLDDIDLRHKEFEKSISGKVDCDMFDEEIH